MDGVVLVSDNPDLLRMSAKAGDHDQNNNMQNDILVHGQMKWQSIGSIEIDLADSHAQEKSLGWYRFLFVYGSLGKSPVWPEDIHLYN